MIESDVDSVPGAGLEERPHLSVVVPAYHEASRLGEPLRAISEYLASRPHSAEFVLVDEGSTDGTFDLVRALAGERKVPLRAFHYHPNRRKDHALNVGFAQARGDRILFTDSDLARPIAQLDSLNEALDQGCDAPCGFKLFRGDVGRSVFSHLRIDDWAFDAELLFLAKRFGYEVQEVPARWEDRSGRKVRLLRDAWSSARGLLEILRNERRGLYDAVNELTVKLDAWPDPEAGAPSAPAPQEAHRS